MAEYLVDTDVLIDHLRGARGFDPGEDEVSCSVITRCELFAGRGADEGVIGGLLGTLSELVVDRSVADTAGRIRRQTGIATPDALIAATALEHDLPLMTRNHSHFKRVPGLIVSAPS